jgi:hypothetical protein
LCLVANEGLEHNDHLILEKELTVQQSKRLVNEFSWSFSRQGTFQECRKKYWYVYYGAWEGWPKNYRDARAFIDPLAAYLYTLKQMQTLPMFVGSVVHRSIEQFLKQHRLERPKEALKEIINYAKKLFEEGLKEAQEKAWQLHPKKYTNLFEYYYRTSPAHSAIAEEDLLAAQDRIATSLSNWYLSPVVQKIAFSPQSQWLSIEELAYFFLQERYKVIVVIDFAVRWRRPFGQELVILFDWKTGSPNEKAVQQLYTYALFARYALNVPYEQQILAPFYLFDNVYHKIGCRQAEALDPLQIAQIEHEIVATSQEMLQLVGSYPQEGSSLPDVRLFDYTTERNSCQRCPFKELCQKANYQNLSQNDLRELIPQQIKS